MGAKEKIAELACEGFCVLEAAFTRSSIDASRAAFRPALTAYLAANRNAPNRGPHRHFVAMPFEFPIFAPEFFFGSRVLEIVQGTLGATAVADQWGCDASVLGSEYQNVHVDYQRPLFPEFPT